MEPSSASSSNVAGNENLTPAQRLMAQHEAAAASHQPTVEDVVDEEDIAHPPPSGIVAPPTSESVVANGTLMSEKAAGKQKARDLPLQDSTNAPNASTKKAPTLDTQSEEAFPSLGAPKPRAAAGASTWGSKPPTLSFGAANINGGQSRSRGPSNASSGSSTPRSGMYSDATTQSSVNARGITPSVSLPGRYTEEMPVDASHLKTRNELRKPIQELIRDVNRRSKAKIEMRSAAGMVYFRGQGPNVESVHQALREVAQQVCAKQTVKVPIPVSVRPHIIGKQGATIQGISKRTGARVQMPRMDNVPLDEDATLDLEIEGDPIAAAMARREIDAIVGQRTSSVNTRMRDVPPELFPFIAGPHNSRLQALEDGKDVSIKIPHYHTWQTEPPSPAPGSNQQVAFIPQDGHHIQIQGDREAARQVQAEIERQVAELQQSLRMAQVDIERQRHQFVLGEKAHSLNDFLQETGCSIIMPPPHEDSETLTIVGPPDQIETAMEKVMDLASSMNLSSVDIAKQHANAPRGAQSHARAVTRYLQEREAARQVERMHNAHVVFPTAAEPSTSWQIYSRDPKNAMRARSDIMNLVGAHPPPRFRHLDIHPFYHRGLQRSHSQHVRDEYGVHVVYPEAAEDSPEIILVYEGETPKQDYELPRTKPSEAEQQAFARALREAETYLLTQAGEASDVVQRSVDTPAKYQDKLRRYVEREAQKEPEIPHPIHFINLDRPAPSQNFPLEFRGQTNAVNAYADKILAFIEEQIRDEAERGYTTTCEFPQKHANQLIGKRGENINKLRDEFDVEIQLNEGIVEIKGPKAKADAARAHIISLGKKLEDETTHALKIPPKYHRELIGTKGAQVNRLQERYNVRINFPRLSPSPRDDLSLADGESNAPTPKGRSQGPDEVTIRGPKRGADEARDELFSLFQYIVDTSHTATVSVAQSQLPSLIGQGGRELENMRADTGAQIDVPGSKDTLDPSGRIDIKVKGTKKQVEDAKKLLQGKAKTFDETVARSIEVDKKYHRALIGREGENLKQIILNAGGSEEMHPNRMIRVPKADSTDNLIRVEGPQDVVDKIVSAIQAIVQERESQVIETIEVPREKHRFLIGRGGETRRLIETECNVRVNIPGQGATGAAATQVKVQGQPNDVAAAVQRISQIVKEQEGDIIQVPHRLHHAIADSGSGNFFKALQRDYRVSVDHNRQQPPPRPRMPAPTANGATAANLPLITDDASAAPALDTHVFELLEPALSNGTEDATIPWVLKGSDVENVAKARALIEAAMKDAESSVTAFLVLPDPSKYRFVIGPGGSVVEKIRKDTGCSINVPKAGAANQAIEIRGQKDQVEAARDMILETVNGAGAGGRRRE